MEGFVRRFIGMVILLILVGESLANPHRFPYRKELAGEIQFWKRIFTEFSRNQYVLHDSEYPYIIYKVVTLDSTLSRRQRARILRSVKQEIRTTLERIHRLQHTPDSLTAWEREIWEQFQPITEPNKFLAASRRVRAQQGIRENFYQGVLRSQAYLDYIRNVFTRMGLPEELCYLPHMESSFNPRAVSKVGAVGMWQFMRSTARWYMKVNRIIDQRWDPFASTHAAAQLLKRNYEELEDWALAITAYNYGLAGMKKAKRKHGKDYLKIRQNYLSRRFGFASRNFYPEFLAVVEIMDSLHYYYPNLVEVPSFAFHEISLPERVNLKQMIQDLNLDPDRMKVLNAGYRKKVWMGRVDIPAGYPLRLPLEVSPEVVFAYLERQKGQRERIMLAQSAVPETKISERLQALSRVDFTAHKIGVAGDASGDISTRLLDRLEDQLAIRASAQRKRSIETTISTSTHAEANSGASPALIAYLETLDRWNKPATSSGPSFQERFLVDWSEEYPITGRARTIRRMETVDMAAYAQAMRMADQRIPREPQHTRLLAQEQLPTLASATFKHPQPSVPEAPIEPVYRYFAFLEQQRVPSTPASLVAGTRQQDLAVRTPPAAAASAPLFRQRASFTVVSSDVMGPVFGPNTNVETAPIALPTRGTTTDAPAYSEVLRWEDVQRQLRIRLRVKGDFIYVFPEETLGHYAEWLQIPIQRLRAINGLQGRSRIFVGQQLRLDFSRVSREQFLSKRVAYHAKLLRKYLSPNVQYRLVEHQIQEGETLWSLAHKKYKFPVNLLLYFNDLNKLKPLYPGERIKLLVRVR
ncbi:MAG: transglycosylase SLT domain-containing protein [Calditrichaeota bacterium]|nr:transglycosylase SLT domain-containing protein [Calditrichota bacterium]